MISHILQPAQVIQQRDTIIVQTEATNIIYNTHIYEPDGAKDGILSTQQNFTVQTDIQYSPNLESVSATLTLPSGEGQYRFQSPADSTQNVISLVPVRWGLKAPQIPDSAFRKIYVTISAKEIGNPIPIIYRDSINVRTILRAELTLTARISYPEGAQDGKVTTGQRFEIKSEVKNNGTALVYGDGYLVINLGSSGCAFADTSETYVKPFQIDSAVTWKLRAPTAPVSESFIVIGYMEGSIPKDENTNSTAYFHPKNDKVNIPITTVPGGNVEITADILSPSGALDRIISTDQKLDVVVQITSYGVRDIESQLLLPGDFSFAPNVSPVQSGESSAQWQIVAPGDSISNALLKVVSKGIDVNNDTVYIYSDTAKIIVDVVKKGIVEVFADIVSPIEATDRIVSLDQHFVVQAYLVNHGQANFDGVYNLQIILPEGYTTEEPLIKNLSGSEVAYWQIKAPGLEMPAANIEVRVPPNAGPRDENSGEEMIFWEENRSTYIPITTYEKSVHISALPNQTPNSAVKGQQNVSMLDLRFFNPKEDELTNKIILSGFKILIKARSGNKISNPGNIISRIAIGEYSNSDNIFGSLTEFSDGSLLTIHFSQPDTIYPDQADTVSIIVDISQNPEYQDVMISIPADTCIFIQEALTNNRPIIESDISGEFQLESDFVIVLGNTLEESFGNYPNPFGSSVHPVTTITYYLKEDTDVDIKIYTLIGELVWSRSFTASDPQGRKGMHDGDVIWDATNDRGRRVLNGIYVIYFKTSNGESAMTKAAVIK